MTLTLRAIKGSQLTQAEMDANLKEVGYLASNIASASTVDLATAAGNRVDVTGTTTITSFGTAAPAGTLRIVRFQGALTLTHNATNLILPMGANLTTRAGDVILVQKEASAGNDGWRVLDLWRCGDGSETVKFLQLPAVYDNGNLGATPTINPANGGYQKGTTSATITTFTISAPPDNLPMTLHLDIYQAAGANYTVTWASAHKWKNGADKALTASNGARDHLVAFYDGAAWVLDLMKGIA